MTASAASNASWGVEVGDIRLDVGIGRVLQFGGVEAGIADVVGVARPQPRDRLEPWRIDRIGGDVVDRRQLVGLDPEIGRIGDKREPDQQRGHRVSEAFDAILPDHRAGAEGEQDGDDGERERAGERRERGHDLQHARAHDDDGEQRRGEREQRDAPRPDGEPRHRLISDPA